MSPGEVKLLYSPPGQEEQSFSWEGAVVRQHIFSGHSDSLFAIPWLVQSDPPLSWTLGKLDRVIWALRAHTAEEILDMGFNLHVDLAGLGITHTTLYLNAMMDSVYLMSHPRPYIAIDVTSNYDKEERKFDSQFWLQVLMCMSLGSGLYDGTVVREDYSDYVLKSGFRDRELDRTALNAINATNLITPGRSNKELLFLAHPLLGDDYGKSIRGRNWLG